MNPFRSLYMRCNEGPPASEFPLILDVELTSACNMRCQMCPAGRQELGRPADFMKVEVFDVIQRQAAQHGTALRFIGWGEPTLHPDLVPFISFAKSNGLLTHLNSNGTKMTRGLAGQLILAGLSSLKFSFQGVDAESYKAMRGQNFFDELTEIIRMVVDVRDQRVNPWIAVSTTTTDEIRSSIKVFQEAMRLIGVDEVSIGKTIFDFLGGDEKRDEGLVHPEPCQEIWHKLAISYDGTVRVCCNDYSGTTDLGNVMEVPLEEIWQHPVLKGYRRRTEAGDFDHPLCKDCYTYLERRD